MNSAGVFAETLFAENMALLAQEITRSWQAKEQTDYAPDQGT
jgi:galactokinase/mevalonate kinase-like predicted kinase